MNILALDTATKSGWAVGHEREVRGTDSGAFEAKPGKHPGERFHKFRNWLFEMTRRNKIDLIIYESVVGGAFAGGKTSLVQKGLEAVVLEVAFLGRNGCPIPVWSFAPATIKKWGIGSGVLTHASKIQMVRTAAAKFGEDQALLIHRPTKAQPWDYDDNQCDALWLLDLARAVIAKIRDDAAYSGPYEKGDEIVCIEEFDVAKLTETANLVTAVKWSRAKKR